jgi:hypothetical protein
MGLLAVVNYDSTSSPFITNTIEKDTIIGEPQSMRIAEHVGCNEVFRAKFL